MPRYIDADAAWKRFYEISKENGFHPSESAWNTEYVLDFIESRDTADVQEVKHGKWIMKDGYITCNHCGCKPYSNSRHIDFDHLWCRCPSCGAKMDLEGEKNDG